MTASRRNKNQMGLWKKRKEQRAAVEGKRQERSVKEPAAGNTAEGNSCQGEESVVATPTSSGNNVFSNETFGDLLRYNVNPRLIGSARHHGLQYMTTIQAAGIPVVLEGCDTLLRAQTGSGKTLVFALPAVQRLLDCGGVVAANEEKLDCCRKGEGGVFKRGSRGAGGREGSEVVEQGNCELSKAARGNNASQSVYRRSDGTRALIICPTRELSIQTLQVISKLSQLFPWIVVTCLTGGDKRKSEKSRLRKGVSIIVSTPGRLLDHAESTASFANQLTKLQMLVLDEADRLLDMGFEQKLRKIYAFLLDNCNRQEPDMTGTSFFDGHDDNDSVAIWQQKKKKQKKVKDESGKRAVNDEQKQLARHMSSSSERRDNFHFQVILVSATLSPSVQRLATFCTRNNSAKWVCLNSRTAKVEVYAASEAAADSMQMSERNDTTTAHRTKSDLDTMQDSFDVPANLNQYFVQVNCKTRLLTLIALLLDKVKQDGKVVVFLSNCDSVEYHYELVESLRWPTPDYSFRDSSRRASEVNANNKQSRRRYEKVKHSKRRKTKSEEEEEEECVDDHVAVDRFLRAPTKHKLPALSRGEAGALVDTQIKLSEKESELRFGEPVFAGIGIFKLHGSLTREDRLGYLADFAAAEDAVLFTTDVASRGLNLPEVSWIVQYDPPQHLDEYIHRIGRTARLGARGNAVIFLQDHELQLVDRLAAKSTQPHSMDNQYLLRLLLDTLSPEFIRRTNEPALFLLACFSNFVSNQKGLLSKARSAFMSTVRAYRSISSGIRDIFSVKQMHLGHLASSFCLLEAPSVVVQQHKRQTHTAVEREMQHVCLEDSLHGSSPKKAGADNWKRRGNRTAYSAATFVSGKRLFGPLAKSWKVRQCGSRRQPGGVGREEVSGVVYNDSIEVVPAAGEPYYGSRGRLRQQRQVTTGETEKTSNPKSVKKELRKDKGFLQRQPESTKPLVRAPPQKTPKFMSSHRVDRMPKTTDISYEFAG